MCHCLECQKRTGGTFAVQARFPVERVTIAGRSTVYERVGESGGRARFHFCPTCSAIVHYTIDAMPDLVAVPVGAFADPEFPPPTFSVYETRKHAWTVLPASIAEHD